MEDVVCPLELAGPFEGEHVERLFDDTQTGLVTSGITADRTERLVADVEAAVAEDDLVSDGNESGRQSPSLGVLSAQQVERQALGGLRSDAGEARECLDEPGDGLDDWAGQGDPTCPGCEGRR